MNQNILLHELFNVYKCLILKYIDSENFILDLVEYNVWNYKKTGVFIFTFFWFFYN